MITKKENKHLIFLIGLPGSGKTFWGKQWAKLSNFQFIDLDEQIEALTAVSISKFFAENGEEKFRLLEHEVLQNLVTTKTNTIVAVGGGTPCFHNNMELMEQHGISIFLNPSIINIIKNLEATNLIDRPVLWQQLANKSLHNVLEELYQKRENFYKRATFVLQDAEINNQHFLSIVENS